MTIEQIENLRKKCSLFVGLSFACFGTAFIFGLLSNTVTNYWVQIFTTLGIISFIVGLVLLGIGLAKFRSLSHSFKTNYLPQIIATAYPGSSYSPYEGVQYGITQQSLIMPRGDRYNTGDLIQGVVGETGFLTCDCQIEERRTEVDSHGNTRTYYVTLFLGRFFIFDFNKEFDGRVVVSESWVNSLFSGFERVKLESVDFNKKFKVYTTNDETAFYILTPQIMEKMMEIEKKYKGSISFSFIGSRMYLAINNGIDTFELKLFKKVDEKFIIDLKKDLETMNSIIEQLKLNMRIFMKSNYASEKQPVSNENDLGDEIAKRIDNLTSDAQTDKITSENIANKADEIVEKVEDTVDNISNKS